jgi:hypothetical protein
MEVEQSVVHAQVPFVDGGFLSEIVALLKKVD